MCGNDGCKRMVRLSELASYDKMVATKSNNSGVQGLVSQARGYDYKEERPVKCN